MGPIGLVANPASGKDVRRLVARASVFDNQEKQAIVRRALIGAAEAGATQLRYLADRHGIVEQALAELKLKLDAQPVDATAMSSALDTISAARAMKDAGCAVVMTLGGDGTNRAFCLGWRTATLVPVSTGTNNVFPDLGEATIAGAAAGLISSGAVSARSVARRCKAIRVQIENERDDLALIDAVLSREQFVGARALLDASTLSEILLTRADPAAVGMTSIGGLLRPVSDADDHALQITLNTGTTQDGAPLRAPIAPGLYQSLHVKRARKTPLERTITWEGPGVLAFDGERERLLAPGQKARLTVLRNGPRVVDVPKTLSLAARKGAYRGCDA
ncbi:MAG: NAD(+)/NADH kinase [Pseudomonadota bacterium]